MRLNFGRGELALGDRMLGFEQIYGVKNRDVTSYRPFVEFCVGLPAELFCHNGQSRWLARQLGKGLMPEAQRLDRRGGFHSCDWHERLTPRLGELRSELERASQVGEYAELIDFPRLLHLLDNWPEQTSLEDGDIFDFCMAVPRAVMAVRYFDFVSGRNEQ